MNQRQIYLEDTYCMVVVSEIIARGVNDGRQWISPAQNILHPQGGGQPADGGTAAGLAVSPRWSTEQDGRVDLVLLDGEGDVLADPLASSGPVEFTIDPERRLRHAALHTAGHLLDAAIRRRGYRHLVSNHFPDEARIEFATDERSDDLERLREEALAEVQDAIAADVAVTTSQDEAGQRVVEIGAYSTDVCGGTHVARSSELTDFVIRSVKVKKGRLKVGYAAEHSRG